jgi:phage tail-like protein
MASSRTESYLPNYFGVEIDGISCGTFYRCEGLESENYVYEVEEGGLNTTTHKFIGRTRYPNLVLEKGLTDNNEIYSWYIDTVQTEDAVTRKDGSIILYSVDGEEVKRWNFFEALPCRWVGPQLGHNVHGCAVERVEIMHEGLEEA